MRKSFIRLLSNLFPNLVVSFAYNQLTHPQVRKLRAHEMQTLDKAEKERISFQGFEIQLYTWKGGMEEILLIHGWEGQAGNFSDVVEALVKAGYTVHAFDGPSHGFSSKGKTSLFEFTDLVGLLIQKYKVKKLISHSFGGVATTYALSVDQNLEIDKYVLITTPDKFTERIDDVAKGVGITDKVKQKLIHRLEKETGLHVPDLNVSNFVKDANVKSSIILHDRDDKVIPIAQSQRVHENWSVSQFEEVTGTGHFRILRSPEVIRQTIDFLDNSN